MPKSEGMPITGMEEMPETGREAGEVAVTGASGFVGHILCRRLLERGMPTVAIVRKELPGFRFSGRQAREVAVGDIGPSTDWSAALDGVETVVHLAARVHIMQDKAADPLAEFRRVNVAGTEQLAHGAVKAGVKRLVYVSSIKVNGKATYGGRKFAPEDEPAPQDSYGTSKWEAEKSLRRVAGETGLEVVVVRPSLVYGPGVKGNFAQMLSAVAGGIPLPLASVKNLRDMVYVENLVDALIACATHPAAAGQTYLACDGKAVSIPDLLRQLAAGMAVPSRLFPFPPALLKLLGGAAGKAPQLERLLGSLQVDGDKMRADLNWSPPYTLEQGLLATAQWYRTHNT